MNWRREILPPIALIATLIIGWWFIAEVSGLNSFILPTPFEVIKAGWETRGILVNAIGNTLLATGIGLVLALITGTGIAALMDFWPVMHRALYPILVVSQTIQILAIAPIFIIWFGFGLTPTIMIVILFCFFPLAVSTADGLTSSDPELVALLYTMKASRWQIWRMVRLPSALPSFFSGLRLAVTYSVVAATIGEWVGGSSGLGLYMLRSKNALATDQVFAAMFITSLLSIVLFMLVYYIEHLVLPWYHSRQRAEKWEGSGIF
jgi:ABC-type nitrate/sulfonate/bicarbonate transport system permease component